LGELATHMVVENILPPLADIFDGHAFDCACFDNVSQAVNSSSA
jgi:hypothetical protein